MNAVACFEIQTTELRRHETFGIFQVDANAR